MARMYIDGQSVDAASGRTYEVLNPATEEMIDTAPDAGSEDVDRAVSAARLAQPGWAATSNLEKARYFHVFAEKLRDSQRELAELLTEEGGKCLAENMDEIRWVAEVSEFYAEMGRAYKGRVIPSQEPTLTNFVVKEPCGVVGAIVPWNYPPLLLAWKAVPALVAGNTVVAKPPPEAPLTTLKMAELLALPQGVLNIVTGGAEAGEAIVIHPGTDMIAFTGTVRAGRRIMELAAQRIKRVNLELSGHDPFIVCDDVDVDDAVEATLWSAYTNAGQVCTSAERIYVMQGVYNAFADRFAERAGSLRTGNGLDPDTDIGPLATQGQLDRVTEYCEKARSLGGVIRAGGKRSDGGRGYFFEPTVITGLSHETLKEMGEVFGPVAPLVPVESFDQALSHANDSDMGLGANILTTDLKRAWRAARELRFGLVWVNSPLVDNDAGPFGGYRMSGIGRELGAEGLDAFMETKHITFDYQLERKYWWYPYSAYSDVMGLKDGRKHGFVGGHIGTVPSAGST
jgi:acyl-CoA reductase-like NAD-dependent aldehyde dehydrogenase